MRIREKEPKDQQAVEDLLRGSWASTMVVAHSTEYDAATLPAIVAEDDKGEISGVLTYVTGSDGLEVVSLDARERHRGIGTALLEAAKQKAAGQSTAARGATGRDTAARDTHARDTDGAEGGGRLWLITTNDNLDALRFYQRRGLRITAVAAGAVDEARKIKPDIPLLGDHGIPIRDEITLEYP